MASIMTFDIYILTFAVYNLTSILTFGICILTFAVCNLTSILTFGICILTFGVCILTSILTFVLTPSLLSRKIGCFYRWKMSREQSVQSPSSHFYSEKTCFSFSLTDATIRFTPYKKPGRRNLCVSSTRICMIVGSKISGIEPVFPFSQSVYRFNDMGGRKSFQQISCSGRR